MNTSALNINQLLNSMNDLPLPRALHLSPAHHSSWGGASPPFLPPASPALGQRALAACSTPVAEYLIKMESLLTQEPGDKTKGPFIGTGSVASVASAMALLTSLWFQTPDRLLLWFSISRIYSPLLAPAQPMTTLLAPAWTKGH